METKILEDSIFAAIAAIGFSSISRLPKRCYPYCAAIAALGHSLRLILMSYENPGMNIIPATIIASLFIGTASVAVSPLAKTPAEGCFFPALLPMIPGIYAYKAFGGLAGCVMSENPDLFNNYFYEFVRNSMVCVSVLIGMVAGATVPVFVFKRISFKATRSSEDDSCCKK